MKSLLSVYMYYNITANPYENVINSLSNLKTSCGLITDLIPYSIKCNM